MAYIKFGGKLQICFASMLPTHTQFETQIAGLSKEQAEEWLTQLEKEIPFKWKIVDGWVKWERPEPYTYAFGILHGNMVKGVNEFAWITYNHLKDKSDKPFLVKNWEAFKKPPKIGGGFYNGNHYPFPYEKGEDYPLKVKTLKEAADLLIKVNPAVGSVWKTLWKA